MLSLKWRSWRKWCSVLEQQYRQLNLVRNLVGIGVVLNWLSIRMIVICAKCSVKMSTGIPLYSWPHAVWIIYGEGVQVETMTRPWFGFAFNCSLTLLILQALILRSNITVCQDTTMLWCFGSPTVAEVTAERQQKVRKEEMREKHAQSLSQSGFLAGRKVTKTTREWTPLDYHNTSYEDLLVEKRREDVRDFVQKNIVSWCKIVRTLCLHS